MNARAYPTLLLALGNDLLGDDAVALVAARNVKEEFIHRLEVVESIEAGIILMDLMAGYKRALLLDSIISGDSPPGSIKEYSREDFSRVVAPSLHYAGLPEVFNLARLLGIDFPEEIRILTMEIEDPYHFGAELSPAVKQALPEYVKKAGEILHQWEKGHA